jgi:hypothetical protein
VTDLRMLNICERKQVMWNSWVEFYLILVTSIAYRLLTFYIFMILIYLWVWGEIVMHLIWQNIFCQTVFILRMGFTHIDFGKCCICYLNEFVSFCQWICVKTVFINILNIGSDTLMDLLFYQWSLKWLLMCDFLSYFKSMEFIACIC